MAPMLRYFTEFGSVEVVEDVVVKKVHVRYLISPYQFLVVSKPVLSVAARGFIIIRVLYLISVT